MKLLRLNAAVTESEILEAYSRYQWWKEHNEICPSGHIATKESLGRWLMPQTPGAMAAIETATAKLNSIGLEPPAFIYAVTRVFGIEFDELYWHFPKTGKFAGEFIAAPAFKFANGAPATASAVGITEGHSFEEVHKHCREHDIDFDEYPFLPIIAAWQKRPEHLPVPDYTDKARVVGMIKAQATTAQITESRETRIVALELANTNTGGTMPLFHETNLAAPPDPRLSVPLIDLWDMNGFQIFSRGGKRAPLEAIFIVKFAGALMADKDRDRNKPVAMSLEDLIKFLWPYDHNLRLKERWPRIRQMLIKLQTTVLRFRNGTAWPFVTAIPAFPEFWNGMPDKEAIVVFEIRWPPGTGAGAQIPWRTLDNLAEGRPGEFRAGIATLSLAFDPGNSRVPIGNKKRWRWSTDPNNYRTYTARQRRELSCGEQKHYHSDAKVNDMWRSLRQHGFTVIEDAKHPDFLSKPEDEQAAKEAKAAHSAIRDRVVDPRTGEIRWIVMPPKDGF